MKRILAYLFSAAIMAIPISSCMIDYSKQMEEDEKAEIQKYLDDNATIQFELKPSGLYYHEITSGNGLQPDNHDTVYVFYTTKLLDGTIFDTNVGTTDTLVFPINSGYVISGFNEGITYMKEGGTSLFLLPSGLAYGTTGDYYGYIPGYTPLIFETSLLKVIKTK